MSYAIIRNANHKMNTVPLLERHNELRNKNYSNKDIDLSRSSENFHLKKIEAATYQQEFERIRQKHNLKGNLRLSGEKQSNVMCEFVITSDKEFFERLGKERTRRFFEDAYNFVTAKVGENFVVSAVVHIYARYIYSRYQWKRPKGRSVQEDKLLGILERSGQLFPITR